MKLNTLFLIHALVALVFGLGFVLAPGFVLSIFSGQEIIATSPVFAQLLGAALIGNSLLTWLSRSIKNSDARRIIVISFLIYFLVATVVATMAQLSGVFNAVGWSNPAHLFFLLLGYGYFLFVKRDYS